MAEILGMRAGMRLIGVADKLIHNMSHKQIIWDIKKHQTPEESSLVPDGTSKDIFTKLKLLVITEEGWQHFLFLKIKPTYDHVEMLKVPEIYPKCKEEIQEYRKKMAQGNIERPGDMDVMNEIPIKGTVPLYFMERAAGVQTPDSLDPNS